MTDERVERRLAAILAADVAGYSRLMGADEEGTIDAKQAKNFLEQGVAFFDVRGSGPWRAGHLKGAFHAAKTIGELSRETLSKFVNKEQPVCFYCAGFT